MPPFLPSCGFLLSPPWNHLQAQSQGPHPQRSADRYGDTDHRGQSTSTPLSLCQHGCKTVQPTCHEGISLGWPSRPRPRPASKEFCRMHYLRQTFEPPARADGFQSQESKNMQSIGTSRQKTCGPSGCSAVLSQIQQVTPSLCLWKILSIIVWVVSSPPQELEQGVGPCDCSGSGSDTYHSFDDLKGTLSLLFHVAKTDDVMPNRWSKHVDSDNAEPFLYRRLQKVLTLLQKGLIRHWWQCMLIKGSDQLVPAASSRRQLITRFHFRHCIQPHPLTRLFEKVLQLIIRNFLKIFLKTPFSHGMTTLTGPLVLRKAWDKCCSKLASLSVWPLGTNFACKSKAPSLDMRWPSTKLQSSNWSPLQPVSSTSSTKFAKKVFPLRLQPPAACQGSQLWISRPTCKKKNQNHCKHHLICLLKL